MSADPISEEIRAFIGENVRSLRALELLLLVQANRQREWDPQELSNELRATPEWADLELRFLESRGLMIRPDPAAPKFRYSPSRSDLEAAVANLAAAYRVRPCAITQVIFAGPRESIRQFADAFRLRKEKPDG